VPSYKFRFVCCWSELPGARLVITGGGIPETRDVVVLDTLREFAVSKQPSMLTPRGAHASVYHDHCVYVLGGWSGFSTLRECERYVCAESRWEALPPLPRACSSISGVVVEGSLYALGGFYRGGPLDLIQKLRLQELTWEIMEFRLPNAAFGIPCFKLSNTEVYLVINKTLYSFSPLLPFKVLLDDTKSSRGPSYYSRGILYCASGDGAATRLKIA
jgi:hypothetical protein